MTRSSTRHVVAPPRWILGGSRRTRSMVVFPSMNGSSTRQRTPNYDVSHPTLLRAVCIREAGWEIGPGRRVSSPDQLQDLVRFSIRNVARKSRVSVLLAEPVLPILTCRLFGDLTIHRDVSPTATINSTRLSLVLSVRRPGNPKSITRRNTR